MADASTTADSKLKIFISYSRKDDAFAQELLAGLQLTGSAPFLDKHDIAAGEDWEARLGRLIETADTVVFVISPDAVASERCAWEVERAVALKKRLLPVVWRRVDEAQVPPRLKQLNYIFFDQPLMSVPALAALAVALKTDLGWIREHTRIGEAALRWDGRGRAEALLFRGDELAAAKAWIAAPPPYAPDTTMLHHMFIRAGEDAQAARERTERRAIDDMRAALEREKVAQADRETALQHERLALNRMQQAQKAIAVLFAGLVALGIGWRSQDYLTAQYQWRFKMGPSVLSAAQEHSHAAKPGSDFKECRLGCPTMVVVPAGMFLMGSPDGEKDRGPDEGPQRTVTLAKPFAVGKTEVTFEEFDACVAAAACQRPSDSNFGRGTRPVINVSWDDVKGYAAWLSRMTGKDYRLLTEAEWEYAARAGSTTRWSFGDDEAQLGDYAWLASNAETKIHPVGQKKPNAFGLYDMQGNVYEWVEDCYGPYDKASANGAIASQQPACQSHVQRGGAFHRDARRLRVADREDVPPGGRRNVLGFRLARTLQDTP
jgi:formylglycine-generating enzyme required for sulfatase activity